MSTLTEKVRRRKKNLQKDSKIEKFDKISKRMTMFGLRIETRDDFDAENYQDFRNIRRDIKDKTHTYRIGPAPITDFHTKPKHYVVSSPGCLDSDLEDAPIGSGELKTLPYPQKTHDGSRPPTHISKAGCRSLISYFAKLGRHEGDEYIDLEFVDSLLRAGADINFNDRYGQTCMHEISRDWHTDVAQFALTRGANVNKSDNYGRTPLHLAAAVNYPEMVYWLIDNGANVDARTVGEEQTPIHYAAKYNAEDALKVLLHMGANIADKDYKSRTPLFVAAETGRSEACCFLLEQGAPAGVYDDVGRLALSLMVQKMPDVAKIALGQFVTVDKALRKKYYYLNYLETDNWNRMQHFHTSDTQNTTSPKLNLNNNNKESSSKGSKNKKKDESTSMFLAFQGKKSSRDGNLSTFARSPLETICTYTEGELIMHPVILRLIAIKWQLYGNYRTGVYTAVNLFYTILWTSLGISMPRDNVNGYYSPLSENIWRIVLEVISLIMAVYFIVTQVVEVQQAEKRERKYKEWKKRELERDLLYCHERWPEEKRYLTSEIHLIRSSSKSYLKNGWNGFEMFTNLVMAMVILTRIVAVVLSNKAVNTVHYKSFPFLLILLWLRFMRYCQIYQSLGPFITMLGHVIGDTLKFGFLFFEFFIPYVCAFWILFGGQPGEFRYFNDVVYQVFLMTLVDEYERDFMEQDRVMGQVLVGTYLAIASVVCLNLYIALMSQTFTRIYQNAKATAYMQQANHLLKIERSLGKKKKDKVRKFMATECSPQVVYDNGPNDDDEDDNVRFSLYRIVNSLNEIKDKVSGIALETATSALTKPNSSTSGVVGVGVGASSADQPGSSSGSIISSVSEHQLYNKLKHIEETNIELNERMNQLSELLQTVHNIITTNISSVNQPSNLVLNPKSSTTSPKESDSTDGSKDSQSNKAEKRNSWDQKLMSVINALTKSNVNRNYQSESFQSSPMDQRRQYATIDGGFGRYFPPSVVNNPYGTLPRHRGAEELYSMDRFDQNQQPWGGKFRSYQDIHSTTPYHQQSPPPPGERMRDDYRNMAGHPELRSMHSTPASHYHPEQQQHEGYHHRSASAGDHRDFFRPYDTHLLDNYRYIGEAQRRGHDFSKKTSSEQDFDRRQQHVGRQYSSSSSTKLPRKVNNSRQIKREKSRDRFQGSSKTSNQLDDNPLKKTESNSENFLATDNSDTEDDSEYERSTTPTIESKSGIQRNTKNSYEIGFEKIANASKVSDKIENKEKSVKIPKQARQKNVKNQQQQPQEDRESKKISKSDIEKVSRLLDNHGYSIIDLKANFKEFEKEDNITDNTEQGASRIPDHKVSIENDTKRDKEKLKERTKSNTRQMPSNLEDVLVEQVIGKAKSMNLADLQSSASMSSDVSIGSRDLTQGNGVLKSSARGITEHLFQNELKDTNV